MYEKNITSCYPPKRKEETLSLQTAFTPEIQILCSVNIYEDTQ